MLNIITHILTNIKESVIEGKFLKFLTSSIDRRMGIIGRKILSLTTPIENKKVFFLNQEGRYSCNLKYISRELEKRRPDVDIVWRAQGKIDQEIPETVRSVKLNSYDYFKEIFSSKVIVANSFLYVGMPFSLKKGQVLIETWHGSLGIKRHDKNAMQDESRKRALIKTGDMTTYCISNSSLETSSLRESYWPHTTILEYGHARNDLFFPNHESEYEPIHEKIFKRYRLDKDAHIAMYAPTFRDSKDLKYYDIDYERLLDTLHNKFGGEWYIFLRYHPSLREVVRAENSSPADFNDRVVDVTEYIDIQELILVTDVGITDYSSWIYDFLLLRRPGFIFATDLEDYDQERGFFYPIEETPFSIATNNDELMYEIMKFNEEEYLPAVEQFLKDKGCVEDGHASERVVNLIETEIDE